jgi:ribonuclease BN (tRNA processing enzyme)
MGVPLAVTRLDVTRATPFAVMENAGVSVSGIAVPHGNVPTIAYKVRAGGATLVFASDQTGTNPAFVEFARGADLLVMHLTIGAGETHPLHASPAVVGQVARDAGARRLILSHLGAFALDAAVAEVRKAYTGRVVVGADLQCTSARQ